jgi:YggT family protein
MQSALLFLFKTLTDLYLLTFLLRFVMQWVRASYYNPFAQFVLKVTNPLVVPARRLLPSVAGLDTPTFAVLLVLECLVTWLLFTLPGIAELLLYAVLRLVALVLWFYTVAAFIYVVLSWFGDRGGNPLGAILAEIVEPILRPARRLLPTIGGLDLAPLLVILLLQASLIALPLPAFLR